MDYSIYLVEDEENLNRLLKSYLEKEGWQVKSFLNGEEAMECINEKPHLWILDIMLPDIDGFQLISEIKKRYSKIPVIFISARDADLDKIIGLEKGSDDYLAKPFSPRELLIRTHIILKRVYGFKDNKVNYGSYFIDKGRRELFNKDNKKIPLTSKEFELIICFIENIGQALSREQILKSVWGSDYFGSDRVVDDLIRRIRKKVPKLDIETIYGYGYRLVKK